MWSFSLNGATSTEVFVRKGVYMTYNWDAETYSNLDLPHQRWGEQLLSSYHFRGDEIVFGAGCGTGRDAAKLAERVPCGKVFAVDNSISMLKVAERRLKEKYPNIEFCQADLLSGLSAFEPVDLVYSVAAFHWISDHASLFRNLFEVMKSGAYLLCDCGGKGNIQEVIQASNSVIGSSDSERVWNFADAESTRINLEEAGFQVLEVRLERDPATFSSEDEFKSFLRTLILGDYLSKIDNEDRDEFVAKVAGLIPSKTVDYVRLKIKAMVPIV